MEFLKRQNHTLHFVEKTVKQIGFPYWDKAIAKQKSKTNGKQSAFNTVDTVNIFYIPFVRDAENYVNASMVVKTTPSDTSFSYLCDWQYKNKVHGLPTVDTSAEHYALFFMMLDNKTFSHREFNLTDSYLFGQAPSRTGKRRVGLLNTSIPAKGKEGLLLYHEICTDYYVCGNPDYCSSHGGCDYLNCLAPEGDPDHCWGITICNSWWEDDWTGGGGPIGIPPPSGGGGDTGIPPTVPCNGAGNIGGQLLPCDPTNPPAPPAPGWVPVEEPDAFDDYADAPFTWTFTGDDATTFTDPNILIEPDFQFDPNDNYETLYPNFTNLVKNLKTFVKNNPQVMNALQKWSGFSKQQILDKLTYGHGPIIKVEEMGGRYAYYNKNRGLNTLFVRASYVRGLEQSTLAGTKQATAFLLAVCILHEFVHYGTTMNNISEGKYEFGRDFERNAFNVIVDDDNAGHVVIKFSQYF